MRFHIWLGLFAVAVAAEFSLESSPQRTPPAAKSPRERVLSILARPFRGSPDQQCLFFFDDHEAEVKSIGGDGVPFLAQALRDPNSNRRLKAVLCLTVLGSDAAPAVDALLPLLGSRTDRQAYWTIICLGEIGKASLPAVPDLLNLLKHPQGCPYWDRIGETIGRVALGNEALPPQLAELLRHESPAVREGVLFALGECGPLAEPLVPKIILFLQDPHLAVRIQAAVALGKIRQQPHHVVPALRRALQDPKLSVRAAAAQAIGAFGDEAAEAVPDLIRLLQASASSVRASAAEAIGRIGSLAGKPAAAALASALSDPRTLVRIRSAEALGKLGPTAKEAVPALTKALSDGADPVRQAAQEALTRISGPQRQPN